MDVVGSSRPAYSAIAATWWWSRAADGTGARLVEARIVDDGDIITAGGVTSGIDLGLWIVERSWGKELADAIAKEMEHPRVTPEAVYVASKTADDVG